MNDTRQIMGILADQDRKINQYLLSGEKARFIYAHYPGCGQLGELVDIHDEGFDNYPLWEPGHADMILFWEKILGCDIQHIDGKHDFFHTYCMPCAKDAGDLAGLKAIFDKNGTWRSYLDKVKAYSRREELDKLPLKTPSFGLLDCACAICGTGRLFTFMHDNKTAVKKLFDYITEVYLSCIGQLKDTGVKMKNLYGFPGTYCNDLQMSSISPSMIRQYLLPCYQSVARACEGLILAINCPDARLAKELLNIEGVIGATFHKGIPIQEIMQIIGRKLFVLNHYIFKNGLDKPTLIDGLYCNPIVESYSRELEEVWQKLSFSCSMLISIERYALSQVIETRDNLFRLPVNETGAGVDHMKNRKTGENNGYPCRGLE